MKKSTMFTSFAVLMILVALMSGCGGGGGYDLAPIDPPAQFTLPIHDGHVATATYDGALLVQDAPDHFTSRGPGIFNFAAVEATTYDTMQTMGGIPYSTTVTREGNPSLVFDRTTVGWVLGSGNYHLAIQSPNGIIQADLTVEEVTIDGLTAKKIPFHVGGELDNNPYVPDANGVYQLRSSDEYDMRVVWYRGTTKVNAPADAFVYDNTVVGSELVRWTNTNRYYGITAGDVYSVTYAGIGRSGADEMVSSNLPVGVVHIRFSYQQ